MRIQTTIRGRHYCEWRNVHTPARNPITEILRDSSVLPSSVFTLLYGHSVYVWRVADNSTRVASFFKSPIIKPIIKPRTIERRNPVYKGDIFAIIDGDTTLYGKVTFVSRSDNEAGVFMFLSREFDRIDLSLFETARGMGKVKWRIHR